MRSEQGDDSTLSQLLRAEAIGSRPSFDAAAAAAVIATIRGAAPAPRRARRKRLAVALAVCLGLACAAAAWQGTRTLTPARPPGSSAEGVALASSAPALDALPTLDELGGDVATGLGILAATVVGLPDWQDLAVAELLVANDWQSAGEPGRVSGPIGTAERGAAHTAMPRE